MTTDFKESKTAKNLAYAFAGESQARNKYSYYAQVARAEGYEQIAAIFEKTANNEMAHAKMWFEELGHLNGTLSNLKDAAAGEHEEWTDMYKRFAEEAAAEGFDRIARKFERVGVIEKRHEERYRKLAEKVEKNEVFISSGKNKWECINCGHVVYGEKAPPMCPVCSYKQAYFEIEAENY